jgi:hypothetical protein
MHVMVGGSGRRERTSLMGVLLVLAVPVEALGVDHVDAALHRRIDVAQPRAQQTVLW